MQAARNRVRKDSKLNSLVDGASAPTLNRAVMNFSNRAIARCLACIGVLIFFVCLIPDKIEARDTRSSDAITDEYVMVGGEPGEDPHLKHQTIVIYANEPPSDTRTGAAWSGRGGDSYRYGFGCVGGDELCVGSRVDWVRRALLQTLLWVLHQ